MIIGDEDALLLLEEEIERAVMIGFFTSTSSSFRDEEEFELVLRTLDFPFESEEEEPEVVTGFSTTTSFSLPDEDEFELRLRGTDVCVLIGRTEEEVASG